MPFRVFLTKADRLPSRAPKIVDSPALVDRPTLEEELRALGGVEHRGDGAFWVPWERKVEEAGCRVLAEPDQGLLRHVELAVSFSHPRFERNVVDMFRIALGLAIAWRARVFVDDDHGTELTNDNISAISARNGAYMKPLVSFWQQSQTAMIREDRGFLEYPLGLADEVPNYFMFAWHLPDGPPAIDELLADPPRGLSAHKQRRSGYLQDLVTGHNLVRITPHPDALSVKPLWSAALFAAQARAVLRTVEHFEARLGKEPIYFGSPSSREEREELEGRTSGLGVSYYEWLRDSGRMRGATAKKANDAAKAIDESLAAAEQNKPVGGTPNMRLVATRGRDAIVSRAAAELLTSVDVCTFSCTMLGGDRPSAELPGVDPSDLAHLDADGRVRVGTEVLPGRVLVGKLSPRSDLALSPELRRMEELRGSRPAELDSSLRCPPHVRGTVTGVEAVGTLVIVRIERRSPLVIGDVLRTRGGAVAAVGAIDDVADGDIAWPGLAGRELVRTVACADGRLHARSIGPYSVVTLQPLRGKESFGGQPISGGAVRTLLARGASVTVHEMLTVKSDDAAGREKIYTSIVLGAPACAPVRPEATSILEIELRALGFTVDFQADQPALALASTTDVRALAPNVVGNAETLDERTQAPVPGGLFCEAIFGRFGSDERRRRLARVELPMPVLHPWAIPIVARLLDTPPERVRAVIECVETLTGTVPEDASPWGARELREALAALDLAEIARGDDPRAEIARTLLASGTRPEDFVLDAWPVLPPDLRPAMPLGGGGFKLWDVNHLYARVINRALRLRRLFELNAPEIILRNQARLLQSSVSNLVENGIDGEAFELDERPLNSLIDMVRVPLNALEREGKCVDYSAVAVVVARKHLADDQALIPREAALELWKPWIYAALEEDGHVTSIKAAKAMVGRRDPLAMAALERVASGYPVVLIAPGDEGRVASVDVALWDEPAIALSPRTIEALAIAPGGDVALHVPVDPRALEEARTHLRGAPVAERLAEDDGWISRAGAADRATIGALLFNAALHCEREPATSVAARLKLGRMP